MFRSAHDTPAFAQAEACGSVLLDALNEIVIEKAHQVDRSELRRSSIGVVVDLPILHEGEDYGASYQKTCWFPNFHGVLRGYGTGVGASWFAQLCEHRS
ncbi:MAG: hypothetical protein IIC01_04615 [Planctomycetes bacterium]|nr:hypothetical protein [Planctomycetota bacterium]